MFGWLNSNYAEEPSDREVDAILRQSLRRICDQPPPADMWEKLHDMISASAHLAPRSHAAGMPLELCREPLGNPFWGLTLRPIAPVM